MRQKAAETTSLYSTRRATSDQTTTTTDSSQDLVRGIANGDESAFAALYDLWADRVHTIAFWILRDGDDAEDVVEETFWQAWLGANRYDERRARVSTWLITIARSRALDRLRARRRRADWIVAAATTGALLEEAAMPEIPGAQPDGPETHPALAAALSALPPEQREALELAFFCGFSHAEIAQRTAQPLGTVKTRIRLAIQKLRQRLVLLD